ncbi:predicted protein [Aspergillus nidulans FGSC A4]|uniref:F-box domain-containing protein n=1 Tax=Emericella nidulans (strain FGSC A4 / ATCC 38163 / CBS 112.46 / NRRL 194 / M139) TaxID=227321 RepID=Q5AXU3_EMENI|nr:hypothetical protein [Aspergillus nidulans FGSC A4]EAA58286.1 predicted protein [Aspergillus nidulans FGSC A4]CBF71665.1 TPA: conserved hypothetical protein [Aspergillus nidulans FGSC A4]|eukprot:XP_664491.1 predicted protein [Aspergillus nidulans FGSC A4]
MAAVNQNMFDACVAIEQPQGPTLLVLPLNLIAQIVACLDDPSDLARLCRTCRVLNYMALPQLYQNLVLTSYDKIRYVGDQPEGMGSASPFTMGLNAVITRPYATLVRSLTLRGDWREQELEEHARVGRVPDSSMMLNITVRAAVDRMRDLEDFRWELSTKMLETVYLGLAQLPKLTSLTIRFPSSRHPRPTTVIPALPHLRYLKITNIDPICYPDDISTMLYKARKLRELKMHWSPRMRNMQEPSVMLHDYFRKCISAKQPLALRSLGLSNLYARHSEDFNAAFDNGTVEEVTMLQEVRSELANLNTFVDSTWPAAPPNKPMRLKSLRANVFNQRQAEFLGSFTGLERIYLVSSSTVSDSLNSPREPPVTCPSAATLTPPASENTNLNGCSRDLIMSADSPSNLPALQARVRDTSINSIVLNHAATLRHLLLPARWALSSSIIARLVHASPQLEQLAFAAEMSSMDTLGLLLPFLRNLQALRLLVPTASLSTGTDEARISQPKPTTSKPSKDTDGLDLGARSFADFVELDDEILIERLGEALADQQLFQRLKVVGFGRKGFVLGEYYTVSVDRPQPQPEPPQGVQSRTPAASRAPSAEDKSPSSYVDFEQTQMNGINASPPSPGSNQNHTLPVTTSSANLPRPQQKKSTLPPSTLGKRTREEDPSVVPVDQPPDPGPCPESCSGSSSGSCSGPSSTWNMNEGLNFDMNECLLPGPRNRALRRKIQRVGWDVLKQWEIWGLDTQEL